MYAQSIKEKFQMLEDILGAKIDLAHLYDLEWKSERE